MDGFYVNPENQDVIVTTKESAYIFPIGKNLQEILSLSREVTFRPDFENFAIDKENNVTGDIRFVFYDENATSEILRTLSDLGFQDGPLREISRQISISMKGKRYIIQGELPMQKLQNEYRIGVRQPRSFIRTAANIVATPGAIAYDAVVVVPSVLVMWGAVAVVETIGI